MSHKTLLARLLDPRNKPPNYETGQIGADRYSKAGRLTLCTAAGRSVPGWTTVSTSPRFIHELFKAAVFLTALFLVEEAYRATIRATPAAYYPAIVALLAFVAVNFGGIALCRSRNLVLTSVSLFWGMLAAGAIFVTGANARSVMQSAGILWAINIACVAVFHTAFYYEERDPEKSKRGHKRERDGQNRNGEAVAAQNER
jgi:hypothetical protein